ncbi:hypothetical protein BSKO_12793 [Bryopsis sp. KO-2023]|nr:hypothetical protein BSKO_12793 [Bryopsis sp. KO-2023]
MKDTQSVVINAGDTTLTKVVVFLKVMGAICAHQDLLPEGLPASASVRMKEGECTGERTVWNQDELTECLRLREMHQKCHVLDDNRLAGSLVSRSLQKHSGGSRKRRPEQDLADLDSVQLKRRHGAPDTTGELPDPNCLEGKSGAREKEEPRQEDGQEELYQVYAPRKLDFGVPHADPVVESLSLAAAQPPDIDYKLHIGDVVDKGSLSSLQLEAICYACQRHEQHLVDGERAGFFLGDGPGVGKGRSIAGLILENWRCGRKRHLWVSISADLVHDARRDLEDVGAGFIGVHPLLKKPYEPLDRCGVEEGVVFMTYSSLISGAGRGAMKTRLEQVLQWAGEEFDGCLIFDEAHRAKNFSPEAKSSTKTGAAVLRIQESLPQARVVYCSATGASELRNMAYMTRLGLWGRSLPGFQDFQQFQDKVGGWGVGALELIAMEMKSRGMFVCRTLSFKGTETEVRTIDLTPAMQATYRSAQQLWSELMVSFQLAMENLEEEEKKDNGRVWPQFWGAHQRFFRLLCMSAKVEETVECAEEAIEEGKCVVIGLQSTGEMRLAELAKEKGNQLKTFASGLKETVVQLIEKHWPMPFPTANTRSLLPGYHGDQLEQEEDQVAPGGQPPRGTPSTRTASRNSKEEGKEKCSTPVETIDLCSSSSDDDEGPSRKIHTQTRSPPPPGPSRIHGRPTRSSPLGKKKPQGFSIKKRSARLRGKAGGAGGIPNNGKGRMHPVVSSGDDYLEDSDDLPGNGIPGGQYATLASNHEASPGRNQTGMIEDRYDCAMDTKNKFKNRVQNMDLPANPLDVLIDRLGGPDKVAEMTGRRGRFVRNEEDEGGVRYEPRNASGMKGVSLEAINVAEAKQFMEGEKLIAIISDAASTGISLHADRRHANQRRRVHLTLELPWSADRAVQQFGRSHRSNQATGPQYRLMMTSLGGESRFAAAVAKRLQNLGALTQGDRNAGPELGAFHYDSPCGRRALQMLYKILMGKDQPTVFPSSGVHENYRSFHQFCTSMRRHMVSVGLITPRENVKFVWEVIQGNIPATQNVGTVSPNHQLDVARFLNRLLGLAPRVQKILFDYFLDLLDYTIEGAKRDGSFDAGITDLSAETLVVKGDPSVISTQEGGGQTLHHEVVIDRGVDYDAAVQKLCDSFQPSNIKQAMFNGFYKRKNAGEGGGKPRCILALRSSFGDKFRVFRPGTGLASRKITMSELQSQYVRFSSDQDVDAWTEAFEEANVPRVRLQKLNVLSGEILPVWDAIWSAMQQLSQAEQKKLRIVRMKTTDSSQKRIIGIYVPRAALPWLKESIDR